MNNYILLVLIVSSWFIWLWKRFDFEFKDIIEMVYYFIFSMIVLWITILFPKHYTIQLLFLFGFIVLSIRIHLPELKLKYLK